MRALVLAVALPVFAALPRASSAEDLTILQPAERTAAAAIVDQLPDLLVRFRINLVSHAHAAECTPEGETCASNEQCCPGLECSGGPPATCSPED
jgi:hypothetical protein